MNYKVKEAAKKLRVSEGHIYKLIKRGDLNRVEGLGRVIRIPSEELKKFSHSAGSGFFKYNPEKVSVTETSLGKIRKIKDKYITADIARALGLNGTRSILRCISKEFLTILDYEKGKEYGLAIAGRQGLSLISKDGLLQYSEKTFRREIYALLKELGISLQGKNEECIQSKIEISEKFTEVKQENGLQVFKNELFQVSLKLENGQTVFDVETVAKSLGFTEVKNGKEYVMWRRVNKYLKPFGKYAETGNPLELAKGDFMPEPAVYKLAFKANNEVAEKFQDWLATEVLPSINHTGGYVVNAPKFINNYFSNFSTDLKHEMIAELEIKIKQLYSEKEKLDKQLLEKINVIAEIRRTFPG